jgi:SAM-dependent methyltransferase
MAVPGPRERLDAIAAGFMEAKVLLTAARLGLFDAVRAPGASVAQAARAVAGSERGVAILLDALVAMEIVAKEGERYYLQAEYQPHLVSDAPDHYPAMLRHRNRLYRGWARLEERVTGKDGDASGERSILSDGPTNRDFIEAMFAVGASRAPTVIDRIDLGGVRTAADLGGGPGHYLVEIGRRLPSAELYLLDLPLTLETARELLRRQPGGERVHAIPWDFYAAPPPVPLPAFDLIFLSQVVHAESEERNRALLRTLRSLIAPGGRLVVHENIVEPDRTQPKEAALFAVNMLAMTDGGRTYTEAEIAAWGREAGFTFGGGERLDARSYLVHLRRPTAP